jgi:hypothetical protein
VRRPESWRVQFFSTGAAAGYFKRKDLQANAGVRLLMTGASFIVVLIKN